MEEVDLLIGGAKKYLTQVWVSAHAAEAIAKADDPKALVEKLAGFSEAGFWKLEGEENSAIRHEIGETYRIRCKKSSLFRLIGFYETARKRDFIILDGFVKPGNDYTKAQWKRMKDVSDVKLTGQWKRRGT
jgi:hypothetical protein